MACAIQLVILIVFNCIAIESFSQERERLQEETFQVLLEKSYDTLETTFWSELSNNSKEEALQYSKAHLFKAKSEKDTARIADAYYMTLYALGIDSAEQYIDSIIELTEENINFHQPARVYLIRANNYGNTGRYREAFTALDKANHCAQISGNIDQLYHIKYLVARLKTEVGEYTSSIEMLEELLTHYKEDEGHLRPYIMASWAYANNLNLLQRPEEALALCKNLIPLSLTTQGQLFYDRLLLSTAISLYEKGEYQQSLDSIHKMNSIFLNESLPNGIALSMNLYLGKIHFKQNRARLAVQYLKKVDSIAASEQYFNLSLRENYTLLYLYYKQQNDLQQQLYYIDKLLKTDSILDRDYKYLTKNVNAKYTIPELLKEKQKINELTFQSKRTESYFDWRIFLVALCIIVLFFTLVFFRKKKLSTEIQAASLSKKEPSHKIDDKTTQRILTELSKIEESQFLLNEEMNLAVLAKALNSNTSYISRIINEHKQLTFKQYLIEYRINFLLKELEEKPLIRNYSIEALAASIGYTNASSFTRIFKKHKGISPSEFLRDTYFS